MSTPPEKMSTPPEKKLTRPYKKLPTPPEKMSTPPEKKLARPYKKLPTPPEKMSPLPKKINPSPEIIKTPLEISQPPQKKFLNAPPTPENFSAHPKISQLPTKIFQPLPKNFSTTNENISTPIEEKYQPQNMLRGNRDPPPLPQHPFFIFISIFFPSLFKKNMIFFLGGWLEPPKSPPP